MHWQPRVAFTPQPVSARPADTGSIHVHVALAGNRSANKNGHRGVTNQVAGVAHRHHLAPPSRQLSRGSLFAGPLGVDSERPRSPIDHFRTNYHLLDAFETWQFEHGIQQDRLHDRAQPAGASLTLDGLASDGL